MEKTHRILLEILFFALIGIICFGSMFYLEGFKHSISKYALHTPTVYFFKFWLITLMVGAYRNKRLKYTIPSLMGLVIFDANSEFPTVNIVHNAFAISFFLITTIRFMGHGPSRWSAFLMICTYPVYLWDIFIGEVLTISVIYLNFVRKAVALHAAAKREEKTRQSALESEACRVLL